MLGNNRIIRNGAYLLGGQVPVQLFNALFALVLIRVVGLEGFGIVTILVLLQDAFGALAQDGLTSAITWQIARAPDSAARCLSNGLVLAIPLSLVTAAAMIAAANLLGYAPAVVELIAWSSSILVIRTLWLVQSGGFRASQQLGLVSALNVAHGAVNLVVGLGLVLAGAGLNGVVVGMIVSAMAKSMLASWYAQRRLPPLALSLVSWAEIVELATIALPFGLRALVRVAYYRLDALLLSVLVGFDATGLYRAAVKIYELASILPLTLYEAIFPELSRLHVTSLAQLRRVFERCAVYLPAAGLPLAITLAWLAEPLVLFAFGRPYLASAPIVATLAVAILCVYVTTPMIGLLNSSSAQRGATALLVAAGVMRVGLDLLLIPRLGAWGAAFATVGAEALTAVLALPLAWTIVRQTSFLRRLGIVFICGAAGSGLAWMLQLFNPWLALFGLPGYLALLLRCGVVQVPRIAWRSVSLASTIAGNRLPSKNQAVATGDVTLNARNS